MSRHNVRHRSGSDTSVCDKISRECANRIWPLRRLRDAPMLRARGSLAFVDTRFRIFVRARISLRFSTRRVALRCGSRRVVTRCFATMVNSKSCNDGELGARSVNCFRP
jgi:hypothetical protein